MERGGRGYRGKGRGADGYGCASSKIDDLSAVAICRERCDHLDRAIQQRFAFTESHMAYILSLKGIGNSLQTFIQQELANSSGPPSSLKKLNLPPQRKGDLDVNSDDSGSLHHSDHSSPLHSLNGMYGYKETDQCKDPSVPRSYTVWVTLLLLLLLLGDYREAEVTREEGEAEVLGDCRESFAFRSK
ncbi:hypothetical protein F8388_024938 [Cannabis sativa]|uniref:DUF630 domain-containing protein n=1 Tax=Cannabis sativa TaxID=3483 RepID=A0A7J6GAD1_CANSA|nr:hypothetical protein G4B88_030342 [Cannabis sativa]KAF4379905.1 hypothetical protein F8388_024938 [Cannabis sativa]